MKLFHCICFLVAFSGYLTASNLSTQCEVYGVCSQGCSVTQSGYKCTCARNFVLEEDQKSCKANVFAPLLAYSSYHEDGEVVNLFTDESNSFDSVNQFGVGEALSISYDGESFYFLNSYRDKSSIFKNTPRNANRASQQVKAVTVTNEKAIRSAAVDWHTKNIYFTYHGQGHITACTNDGKQCKQIVNNNAVGKPGKIHEIVLKPDEAKVFWSSHNEETSFIGVSFMDGSRSKVLVENVKNPQRLTSDAPNNRLYWINSDDKVESVRMDGKDRRFVLEDIKLGDTFIPYSKNIAVFGNRLFWFNSKRETLYSVNKFTGQDVDVHLIKTYVYCKIFAQTKVKASNFSILPQISPS